MNLSVENENAVAEPPAAPLPGPPDTSSHGIPGSAAKETPRRTLRLVKTEPISFPMPLSGFAPGSRVFVYSDENGEHEFIEHSRARRRARTALFNSKTGSGESKKDIIVVPRFLSLHSQPWLDISFQVPFWFGIGSVLWVVNGHYHLFPLEDKTANDRVAICLSLLGTITFLIGTYLGTLEGLNEREPGDFTPLFNEISDLASEPLHVQRYIQRQQLRRQRLNQPPARPARILYNSPRHAQTFRWFGFQKDSVGFWGSFSEFIGTIIFMIAVVFAIPGVLDKSGWKAQVALIHVPEILGSIGFTLGAALHLLEEQKVWYLPRLQRIGWHAPFWSLIGSLAFLIASIAGLVSTVSPIEPHISSMFNARGYSTPIPDPALQLALNMVYFGSWAFLAASVLMAAEDVFEESMRWREFAVWLGAWMEVKLRLVKKEDVEGLDKDVEMGRLQSKQVKTGSADAAS